MLCKPKIGGTARRVGEPIFCLSKTGGGFMRGRILRSQGWLESRKHGRDLNDEEATHDELQQSTWYRNARRLDLPRE